jgi:hypothetical protein
LLNKIYNNGKEEALNPENNLRYQYILDFFHTQKKIDLNEPNCNTYIKRSFEREREIPIEKVENLFIDFISSPEVKKVSELIKNRLGRSLEPFDIWYDGFKNRSSISEEYLTNITQEKYPDVNAIQKDLPNILRKIGFTKEKAESITSKIQVDAVKGSGCAYPPSMRGEKAHLATRVRDSGLDYKGYNIAIHEFGHNVEEIISMNDVDYYMMNGIPNTAFTEALAIVFQSKDLELLGIKESNTNKKHVETLDLFWNCYEVMGASLVEQKVWKWLYKNENANAEQLNDAVNKISKDVWNKYYADVFGVKDQTVLGIYSHMIACPLYLSNYSIGHIIRFQLEKHFEGKDFASEVERMFSYGRTTPQNWMNNAVGEDLSIEPLLQATNKALSSFSNPLARRSLETKI